jgi:glycolate oxidase FAD binding subunit
MPATKSIQEELLSIVGSANLRLATQEDAICGIVPQFVIEPENEQQLAAALSCADAAGASVVPRGGATKMGWGNPPKRADLILSTRRMNQIVEHVWADLTVTVEAACTLQSLQAALAKHGQRLAFDGLWPERATIGGVLSTNDSGALRLRFGSLRDLVIGVTLALPDGTLASSGGKVVKNVAGYDLPKLATGALGTLGVITRAVFRLHPLPRKTRSFSFPTESFAAMQAHVLAIQDSKLAHTSLQIRASSANKPFADILFEATDAGLDAQESQLRLLLRPADIQLSPENVWHARQELWNSSPDRQAFAKISLLPSEFAKRVESIAEIALAEKVQWHGVVQATGIGILRLDGLPDCLSAAITRIRTEFEQAGGSLVLLNRPADIVSLDAWGSPGDTLPLLRAVKNRLDPKNTLNPGRFVGGI